MNKPVTKGYWNARKAMKRVVRLRAKLLLAEAEAREACRIYDCTFAEMEKEATYWENYTYIGY